MSELDWLRLISKSITESKLVTKRKDPKNRVWEFEKTPNYRTWEIHPSQKLGKGKPYYISGTDASVMQQGSLIKALHEILGDRLGYTIDFNNWFEDFSLEFKKNPISNQFREGARPNDVKDEDLKYWGVTKDERPKFKWIEPRENPTEREMTEFHQLGYSVIKFWKNRSKKDDFIFVSGTLTEIRNRLIDMMQTVSIGGTGNETGYKAETISFVGLPKVVLYFREAKEDVEDGYPPIESRISFRIINKTDNPNSDLPKLTKADIRALATKIDTIFNTKPNKYKIHRGKETVSVKDKNRGYEGYIHVYSQSDGIDLFTKLYQLQDLQIDLKKIFHKVTIDEMGAYPTTEPDITVLGKTVRPARIRPVGYVVFSEAKLFLSRLDTAIKLVDADGMIYNEPDA